MFPSLELPPLIPKAQEILDELLEGNRRFRTGEGKGWSYTEEHIAYLATHQTPKAALVACSDSRVSPEIVFDQPLGALFVGRTPGNVAADSTKWMLEMAVTDLRVPLVLVVGHVGCLALKEIVDGKTSGAGGMLRLALGDAVYRARQKNPVDLHRQAVIENARLTAAILLGDSYAFGRAIREGRTSVASAVYDIHTGLVEVV